MVNRRAYFGALATVDDFPKHTNWFSCLAFHQPFPYQASRLETWLAAEEPV